MPAFPRPATAGLPRRRLAAGLAAALAAAVLALYAPARRFAFIDLDDNDYVFENAAVLAGLARESVHWALTAYHSGHWHPLTWLSLMADVELSGVDAGAMHATSVALHAAGCALLFGVLRAATGRAGASAFAAALFALHPLRVESVAWVATRKDVLSGLFLVAMLGAYVRYARRGTAGRYALVALAFVAALLAKPTVAIAPCILLLLDAWPLARYPWAPAAAAGRCRGAKPGRDDAVPRNHETAFPTLAEPIARRSTLLLVAEKLPLFALAGLTLLQTWAAQNAAGAINHGPQTTFLVRLANAAWNYALYLGATFWPFDLAPFYPLQPVPPAHAAAAAALVVALTAAAAITARQRPWLLVGWLWFCGTLLPVSGVVQFGGQSMADRYTYIPHLGLLTALAWEAAARTARWPAAARAFAATLLLAALALRTSDQLGHWKDTFTLFAHGIEVTRGNYMLHNNLGVALEKAGRSGEAAAHYLEAARLNPTWPEALNNAGIAHAWAGRLDEAERHFAEAVRIRPGFARAHNNLGTARGQRGDFAAALAHYRRAVELDPSYVDARYALADAAERLGLLDEAELHYAWVVEHRPDLPGPRQRLANLRASRG